MHNLNDMIEVNREKVLDVQELSKHYATVDLAKIRIKEEAKKLNYMNWYDIRELDGQHLLKVDEEEFIMILFKAVLKRRATAADARIYLDDIRYKHVDRIDVIDAIQNSEEAGQYEPILITGLEKERKRLYRRRRIQGIPILGYILRWCKAIILLPRELYYTQEQCNQIGLRTSDYDAVRQNVENMNDILQQSDLTSKNLKLERQRKQYEKRLIDRFYAQYNKKIFTEPRELLKERKQIYIQKLEEYFLNCDKSDIKVVDLGCETGEWVEVLLEAGYQVIDAHIDTETIHKNQGLSANYIVKKKNSVNAFEQRLQDSIAFLKCQPQNSYDVITSFHMVEHMEMIDIMELCQEAARVLKPNGVLIIETPNPLNVLISSYYFYLDPTHKHPIPPELLEVYVSAGGLKVRERIFVNPLDFEPYKYYKEDDPIKDIVFRFNMEQAYSIVAVKK